jgi:type IV pilus assembly protein PilA
LVLYLNNLFWRNKMKKGFTLIELLVVVAIIGILAAIAIPQFSEYRKRGYEAGVKSDLRNIATAEEAYFVGANAYVSCGPTSGTACTDASTLGNAGFKGVSKGNVINAAGTATDFTVIGNHPAAPTSFTWNSQNGGLQ